MGCVASSRNAEDEQMLLISTSTIGLNQEDGEQEHRLGATKIRITKADFVYLTATKNLANGPGDNHNRLVSAASMVTKNARLILMQHNVPDIPQLLNLPNHQKAAQAQASYWLNNMWELITESTAEIIDYSRTFTSSYKKLEIIVPKLKAGNTNTKNEFIQTLQYLRETLAAKRETAARIASEIKSFHEKFKPKYKDFESEFLVADLVVRSDKQLNRLTVKMARAQAEAMKYEFIAVSAGVVLPITAAASFALTETEMDILVGAFSITAEVSALSAILVQYAEALEEVHDLIAKIHSLNIRVAQLYVVENQITGFYRNSQNCVTASEEVEDGWAQLIANMEELISKLYSMTPQQSALIIEINLDIANQEWKQVLKQLEKKHPREQLPGSVFEDSKQLVEIIKNQAKPPSRPSRQ